MTKPPIVLMKDITKRFTHTVANDGIDFELREGEIHALLGENGAGKTTLMKILSGLYQPDSGEILINGKSLRFFSPEDAMRVGIGMVHQHFELVPNLTVTENIMLGACEKIFLNLQQKHDEVKNLSKKYGLEVNPELPVWQLSVGEQQRVEILKMLYRKIRVLIMDEPTASLTQNEIKRLFITLEKITREGCSVIFITHKLEEVLEIANYITVLRRGKVMATIHHQQLEHMDRRQLATMMVGREVILRVNKDTLLPGETLIKVKDLHIIGERGQEAVTGLSFEVKRGEIFCILGVAGNGQRELVEAVVGLREVKSGHIKVKGKLNYIPEDRLRRGSVPSMTLAENVILTRFKQLSGGFLKKRTITSISRELIKKFDIRPQDPDIRAGQLSGGNLQKLILARELSQSPDIIVAEQPTAGLDIASTEDVWRIILEQRNKAGVLLVTGDLREALSISDRIAVIFRGSFMDVFCMAEEPDKIDGIEMMMAGLRYRV